jgi:hypothetical protein
MSTSIVEDVVSIAQRLKELERERGAPKKPEPPAETPEHDPYDPENYFGLGPYG